VDLNPVRQTNPGDADRMVLAFELVLTPTIFGFLGYLLDGWLGTLPVFTVVLAAFTLGYTVWKLIADYDADMEADAQRRADLRNGRPLA
jgi:F0F1-type ATP synthase assembly protein I